MPDPRTHRALASLTRSRLLAVLRSTDTPLGVRDLADAVGLHPNSVREQLDRLAAAGLVARMAAAPSGRGRPAWRYVATEAADEEDAVAYRGLARALAEELRQRPDPVAAATAAGDRWGRALAGAGPAPADAQEAVARLVGLLDDAGFAPETPASIDEPVRLRRCPFIRLARDRRDVVCSVHLGLMRGALRQLDAPLDAVRLEPFVRPDLCLAHLAPRTDG